jgi:hypothetical protein
MDKKKNLLQIVTHRRQNPLDFTKFDAHYTFSYFRKLVKVDM